MYLSPPFDISSPVMNAKTLTASLIGSLFLFPMSAAAFETRRGYSDFWDRTFVENSVDLADRVKELETALQSHQQKMDQHEKEYAILLEGLQYEKSTLERGREALDQAAANNELIERDILSRFALVGAPNHLKRWRLQKSLRNAEAILSEDKAFLYQDLEQRETLLATETTKIQRKYASERRKLQKEESFLKREIAALQGVTNYAKTDRRNVFLGSILKPEREDFLFPRRLEHSVQQARRAEQMKAAVKSAKTDNYLTRVQPEVQNGLEAELADKELEQLKMFEKALAESLGSNLSPEELKRLYLQLFMQGN
ncbi:hypothetical protein A2454_06895 [Candidatus Peribacteria bacterium RIFOXYC2_FULL_55_14]|nr:MAG: hypothetical protein A2454_06895 [Candidatus Peribacteria bacterium RIFOXYC2_FULL_55_14]